MFEFLCSKIQINKRILNLTFNKMCIAYLDHILLIKLQSFIIYSSHPNEKMHIDSNVFRGIRGILTK